MGTSGLWCWVALIKMLSTGWELGMPCGSATVDLPQTLFILISDALSSISLCSAVFNLVVYSNNLIEYNTFVGAFTKSQKALDHWYSPRIIGVKTEFPTIVLESEWTEEKAQVDHNCQLWLECSLGAVKVLIKFKLFRLNVNNQIKANLNVCRMVKDKIVMDKFAGPSVS